MDINDQQFTGALRSALHYLYDPDQLRRSPLIEFTGLAGRVDASLKPDVDDPPQSHAWRLYDLLFFRYVRGYERLEVADQLGISERQLNREQKTAIEALAQHLWKVYPAGAGQKTERGAGSEAMQLPEAEEQPEAMKLPEAAAPHTWAEDLPAEKPAAWKPVVGSVLNLLRPLALHHRVTVRYEPDPDQADLIIPQYALRHALLNLLGLLIPATRGGLLLITPDIQAQELTLEIEIRERLEPGPALPDPAHASIAVARQLLEQAGGSLRMTNPAGFAPDRVAAVITLPARELVPVVVIDDNPDSLQLFQRYAQGTPYQVTGIQDPTAALRLAEQTRPRIILLDVMMPEVDGWEMLTRLRQEAWAQNTAIIICSILPQADLALSLGADAFLGKPVLPQDFLNLLDQMSKSYHQGL
jgi:CheY-like chemotaxis protein